MAEPASGTVAATAAVASGAGGIFAFGSLMPPGASASEFLWGCFFAAIGAAAYQFIEAFAARQDAAQHNVPVAQRPTIDMVMLGYAMIGAILSAAGLTLIIHQFKGATGFGDLTWIQSAAGYMFAGPAGPKIVIKFVGYLTALVSSKIGGKNQ